MAISGEHECVWNEVVCHSSKETETITTKKKLISVWSNPDENRIRFPHGTNLDN
jgi:hypothetical protein